MTQIPEMLETGGSVTDSNQRGLLCWRGCLGKACQQAKQGALHSADSLSVTWALQACNCVFKPPRFVSAETIVCVRVFLPQERLGQKRK